MENENSPHTVTGYWWGYDSKVLGKEEYENRVRESQQRQREELRQYRRLGARLRRAWYAFLKTSP